MEGVLNWQDDTKGIEAARKKSTAHTPDDIEATSPLPLSPLMDSNLQAARNRYKTCKPEPSGEPSEFQKKLWKNPYAQALATPVRSCTLTGVRLPSSFLLDFGLTPHPTTGKPWQLPKLLVDSNINDTRKTSNSSGHLEQGMPPSVEDDPGAESPSRKPVRTVAGSYIIAQRPAVKLLSNLKQKTYMQMIPQRWKQDGRFKAEEIVWRQDMDNFVLELMRRKTVKLLKYLSSQPAAYIVACEGYEDIQNKHQLGAVLWLGEPDNDQRSTSSEESPPPYAMMEYRSSGPIPLYNLPALLGLDYLHQLRDSGQSFNRALAVIKQKRNTTHTQLQLWELMGYMAHNVAAG
ncbi:MAG: hypothetical protein Q9181_003449 [Wetmoreana brouardii]